MTHFHCRKTAGRALLIAGAALSLCVSAAAQELKPKGNIIIKKTLPSAIAFSPDGRYLAINGDTGDFNVDNPAGGGSQFNVSMNNMMHVVLLVDVKSGKIVRRLYKGSGGGFGFLGNGDPVAFSSDGRLIMAVFDKAIQVWEVEKGKKVGAWGKDLREVAFSQDRQLALARHSYSVQASGFDYAIEAIGLKDGRGLATYNGEKNDCLVPIDLDRPSIVYLKDEAVILKNLKTSEEIALDKIPGKRITSAAVSADGNLLAVCTEANALTVWSLGDKKKLFERLGDDKNSVGNPIFSPDNSVLIYWQKDQLAVRSLTGETESAIPHKHFFNLGDLVFANSQTLASTGIMIDPVIKFWTLSSAPGGSNAPVPGPAPAAVQDSVSAPAEASSALPAVPWAAWDVLSVQRRSSAYEGMSPGPELTPGNVYLDVAVRLVNESGKKADFKYPHAGIFLRQISTGRRIKPRDLTNQALRTEVEKYRQKGLFQNVAKDFVLSASFAIDPGKKEEFSLVFEVPENAPDGDFELNLPNVKPQPLAVAGPAAVNGQTKGLFF